jgi:nickel/cobalt transporter (NiCoT) family protein
VFAASIVIALTAAGLHHRFSELIKVGGVLGTSVSALFLFAVAMINIVVLASVCRLLWRVRRGEDYAEHQSKEILAQRGLLSRLFRTMFRVISRSWHMYPLGFLFGLGFDTATEIGLLGISAAEVSKGLSIWSILVFPALFATGMALVDTSDGVLMVGAYGWALTNPVRKLYYNLTITGISVTIAVAVGAVELVGLFAEKLGIASEFADFATRHLGAVGYSVIGIFAVSWLASFIVGRVTGSYKIGSA